MSNSDNIYLPVIRESDYEAFRSIMHNELPPAYNAWLQRHADRIAHYEKSHRIVEIEINPDDFAAFL